MDYRDLYQHESPAHLDRVRPVVAYDDLFGASVRAQSPRASPHMGRKVIDRRSEQPELHKAEKAWRSSRQQGGDTAASVDQVAKLQVRASCQCDIFTV